MAHAVCSSAPLCGAEPFLRTCRLDAPLRVGLVETLFAKGTPICTPRAGTVETLVCHVSAVPRGRSPVNCFPQLGHPLFVITSEAITSRSRSSQILMGLWSAQRNDYTKK
jgi:hypothetical protein